MKYLTLKDSYLKDFLALLSDDVHSFIEKSLDKYEIVNSIFTIEINSYVHLQCIVNDDVAYILAFNYGKYSNLNYGKTKKEIEFIRILQNKYYDSNNLIRLSPKNKLKLLRM